MDASETYVLGKMLERRQIPAKADRQLIRAALKAARNIVIPASDEALTTDKVLSVIDFALEILSQDSRLLEVKLALTSSLPEPLHDRAVVVGPRLQALVDLGLDRRAKSEATRLLEKFTDDHPEAALIRSDARKTILALRNRVPQTGAAGSGNIGPEPNLIGKLDKLDVSTAAARLEPSFVEYFMGLRSFAAPEEARIRSLLAWGNEATNYRKFLTALYREARSGESRLLGKDRMAFLNGYVDDPADLFEGHRADALDELVAAGRSIIVLQCHSGARGMVSRALKTLNCPVSLVGRQSKPPLQRDGDFDIATADAFDLPLQFLKLTKLHRKSQRVTRIFPDGQDGQSFRSIELFGRQVQIGMGGSTLAYYGKAVLAFANTTWTGVGWKVAFHLGPDIGLARDSTEANQIFADYYAESLRKLLLGPVIDIGGVGGYLGQLRKAQP